MKKEISWYSFGGGACYGACVCLEHRLYGSKRKTNDVIPDNVYIGEVAVGGMTFCGSKEAVEDYVKENKDGDVVLTAGENSVTVKTSDLGLTWETHRLWMRQSGLENQAI